MQLPNNEVGITDILQYRDCPQRMGFGMRRHTALPERFALFPGEKDEPDENVIPEGAYGSAIHDCIAVVEKTDCSDQAAIDQVWPRYQHWLDPEDLESLTLDLEKYHTRQPLGVKTVAVEADMRVPLFVQDGVQYYFRFKLDVLQQRLDNAAVFLHRDYKSSKWRKTAKEVHSDLQLWAYNWGIHEYFPECETLLQVYDQLRFGEEPTRKSVQQRAQIKSWLIQQVKAILADEVMAPKLNDWCPWCALKMDCRVTHLSTTWWKRRLAAISRERKEGRKIIVELTEDAESFEDYVTIMPRADATMKTLERFVDAVKDAAKKMPQIERERLGISSSYRRQSKLTPDGLRQIQTIMGDEFFQVVGVSKAALEEFYGKGDAAEGTPLAQILSLFESRDGAEILKFRSEE